MRNKNKVVDESGGVADGFNFDEKSIEKELAGSETSFQNSPSADSVSSSSSQILHNSTYKKYYKPHPKKGKRGGDLGRPLVDVSIRKVQFSITCTPSDKNRFQEAAKKDHRKLPDFVKNALDEYIERHHLE